ncbi:MAG: hypothetical protein LBU16_10185, partial [Treponema sp.]|jgi:hypothetical protein|nr:hypothetical protein [Treponema sp.]
VTPPSPAASTDLSTQLLMKIADELSAIKGEISSLKGEFSAIRSQKPRIGGDGEDAGFFDEEDDDKIALTGDELNNIIHTADFTEETGFDAGASLADDFALPDSSDSATAESGGSATAESEAPSETSAAANVVAGTVVVAAVSAAAEALGQSGEAVIYDGLGRPLRAASPGADDDSGPATPAPAEAASDVAAGEIIYDGLGRPLNRKISGDDDPSLDVSFDSTDSEDLRALRDNGVEPMTPPPEDTSYLEEDPLTADDALAEEDLDLSDAVIDEPDLSEGVKDTPLEEPPLDNLPLIDLGALEDGGETAGAGNEESVEERPFFEDITFEDLSADSSVGLADIENLNEEEAIDLSIFEDDFPLEDSEEAEDSADAGDLSFEVLDDDAELPVQQNFQDNVITDDSFEPISLDDDGEIGEVTTDEDLEQSLSDGLTIDLEDLPPLELPSSEEEDDINFSLPGSAETADAGDQTIARAEAAATVRMELKDVLIYMDKLLEFLPEEKIHEFAQSEHYVTYRKLFEELGIRQ